MSEAPNAKRAFGVDLAMNCATTNAALPKKICIHFGYYKNISCNKVDTYFSRLRSS